MADKKEVTKPGDGGEEEAVLDLLRNKLGQGKTQQPPVTETETPAASEIPKVFEPANVPNPPGETGDIPPEEAAAEEGDLNFEGQENEFNEEEIYGQLYASEYEGEGLEEAVPLGTDVEQFIEPAPTAEKLEEEEAQEDGGQPVSVQDLDEMIRLLSESNMAEIPGEESERPRGPRPSKPSITYFRAGEEGGEDESEGDGEGEAPDESVPDTDRLMVLGPNHPKMKRFQKVLREHLEKQLYNAQAEGRDLEKELRETQKERQDTGSILYNLQYELARQTDELAKYEKKIEKMADQKEELDAKTIAQKVELDDLNARLKEEMKREETLIKAMKEIDVLEFCVRQAVEEFESEKKVQENIHDKIMELRDEAEIKKRDQDYYLDKIASHVERMEQANAGIQRQIQAHLDEQKDLQAMINEAGTEIEALQMEKKHLQRAWNDTLAVIRGRDEALTAARNALLESKEHVRNRESEIRYLNRAIAREQVKHEQASLLLKRRDMENRKLTMQLNKLNSHVEELESQLLMLQNVRAEMEAEFLRINNELLQKQKLLQKPLKKYNQLVSQKRELEDKILKDVLEKTAMDKIAVSISKNIEKAREKTREMEFQLVKIENEMTEVTANVEKLRTDVLKKTIVVEELEKKMTQQEQVIQDQMNDLKISEKLIAKKTIELDRMNRKLQKLVAERGSENDSGPLELEIDELEKQIAASRAQCVEMQEEWLRLQDKVVQLTQEREQIASENELIQKETFIMERKKARLEQDLTTKEQGITKMRKQIELTKADLARLNAKQYQSELEESKLADQNNIIQNELVFQLRDAELEVMDMEAEVELVKREQEMIEAVLSEAHEQCLVWEKKCKLIREVQKNIKFEQENTNKDIKLQIHHMKVRYGELQRVQEKLMTDLEATVKRRDSIIQRSEHELAKANTNPERTKLNIQRNIKRIGERTKKMMDEVKQSEQEAVNTRRHIEALNKKLECEAAALQSLKEVIEQDDQKLIEAAINKHKYAVEISLRQKKYKILEAIHLCQFKPSWKGIENVQEHISQLEQRCVAIAELCDVLLTQFPEHELQIKLIKASIYSHVK